MTENIYYHLHINDVRNALCKNDDFGKAEYSSESSWDQTIISPQARAKVRSREHRWEAWVLTSQLSNPIFSGSVIFVIYHPMNFFEHFNTNIYNQRKTKHAHRDKANTNKMF